MGGGTVERVITVRRCDERKRSREESRGKPREEAANDFVCNLIWSEDNGQPSLARALARIPHLLAQPRKTQTNACAFKIYS